MVISNPLGSNHIWLTVDRQSYSSGGYSMVPNFACGILWQHSTPYLTAILLQLCRLQKGSTKYCTEVLLGTSTIDTYQVPDTKSPPKAHENYQYQSGSLPGTGPYYLGIFYDTCCRPTPPMSRVPCPMVPLYPLAMGHYGTPLQYLFLPIVTIPMEHNRQIAILLMATSDPLWDCHIQLTMARPLSLLQQCATLWLLYLTDNRQIVVWHWRTPLHCHNSLLWLMTGKLLNLQHCNTPFALPYSQYHFLRRVDNPSLPLPLHFNSSE